ncbi:MAG: thiamine-phosphate kinase [Leptospiraceae bacterium]|nr:thiamine-phosphate kinase [Leptospiraceae bacterium]MDW8307304.1 thiamine-phosphate kinase [Leptospiraceae bacterium]
MLSEEKIIELFRGAVYHRQVSPPGDDAAYLEMEKGRYLLFSTDQLIEGTHFLLDYFSPQDLAIKLTERCLSDIYVKGGRPLYALLNMGLSLSLAKEGIFVKKFARALKQILKEHQVSLIGGDTARSEKNHFSLAVLGESEIFIARQNKSIQKGDILALEGYVGGSDYVLSLLQTKSKISQKIKNVHLRPRAWAREAHWLKSHALAALDQSDSLYESLFYLALANKLHLRIELSYLPLIEPLKELEENQRLAYLLSGGEDLAVVAIVKKEKASTLPPRVSLIGEVEKVGGKPTLAFFYKGQKIRVENLRKPFAHFRSVCTENEK